MGLLLLLAEAMLQVASVQLGITPSKHETCDKRAYFLCPSAVWGLHGCHIWMTRESWTTCSPAIVGISPSSAEVYQENKLWQTSLKGPKQKLKTLSSSWIFPILLFLLWGFILQQEKDWRGSLNGHVLSGTSWGEAQKTIRIYICMHACIYLSIG